MIRSFLLTVFLSIAFFELNAQNSDSLETRPAQLTLIYPVGVFGINSQHYVYPFSINVLAGRTGAVNGFELGGCVNINDKYMEGFQAAGIGNMTFGKVTGFQASGIFNLVRREVNGFQGAAVINASGGYSHAGQIAGIANFSPGIQGAQFAGVVNASIDSIQGVQMAGIANFTLGNSEMFQVAGVVNVSENMEGAQMAGIVNAAWNSEGVQMAGIVNTALRIKGAQIAGIGNVAKDVDGIQLAGIFNICDSIHGIPIALVSIVRKNGYRRVEVSMNEFMLASVSYKTGIREFYTLFSAGYRIDEPEYNIAFGVGAGTSILNKKGKSAWEIEVRMNSLNKNLESDETVLYNSLIIDYARIITKRVELFVGPSINVLYASEPLTAVHLAPEWARAYKYDNRYWGWAGVHGGIRF